MSTTKVILSAISILIFFTIPIQAEKIRKPSVRYFHLSSDSLSTLKNKAGFKATEGKTLKDNYLIVYDNLYDMHGTAQDLFTVSRLFGRGFDLLTCRYDKYSREYKCLDYDSYIGRLFIDGIFNLLFTNWLSTIQHECNGHGFRIREEGVPINKYYVNPGMLSDKGRVDFNFYELSFYGKLLYASGGPESNTIFSREAFRYGLQKEYFNHYYIFSYLLKLDLPMYILGGTEVGSYSWENGMGDVVKYCMTFDEVSDFTKLEAYEQAKRGAYISLLDPSLLLSFYQYIKDYIIKGNAQVQSPLITIKQLGILPFIDFHLSPYGFEYYIGSYLRVNRTLFESYYRWSYGHQHGESCGFGIYASNLLQFKKFSFDSFIDYWHQDFDILYYETDSMKYFKKINSAKVAMVMHYKISKTFTLSGDIGYKGEGFLIGNPIDKGFSYKVAIGAYF